MNLILKLKHIPQNIFIFFLIGLFLKIALICLPNLNFAEIWYVPFVEHSLSNSFINPWETWVSQGGQGYEFPYGYIMLLILLPLQFIFSFFHFDQQIGYFLTLLIFDFMTLKLINKSFNMNLKFLIVFYWLNPLIIIPTFIFGFNDLIPLFFLVTTIYFMKRNDFYFVGFFLMITIATKLTFIVILPFFIIFYLQNKFISNFSNIVKGTIPGIFILICQLMFSSLYSQVAQNSELLKIYELKFELGDENSIFIIPIILVYLLYYKWNSKKITLEILCLYLFTVFILISVFSLSSPGWFLLLVPFFLMYIYETGNFAKFLFIIFNIFYSLYCLQFYFLQFNLESNFLIKLKILNHPLFFSSISTVMVGIGLVIFFRMYYQYIKTSKFMSFKDHPFLISISGDSSSGKDTLSKCLINILGKNSICQINGDDYHLYERKSSEWKIMTHLNPLANDLSALSNDIEKLKNYKKISRRTYNHQFGFFDPPSILDPKEFLILNSIHSFYLPLMSDLADLKIYLDMEEDLRRSFKVNRDVKERGHLKKVVIKSINNRVYDAINFVHPQKEKADLIFRIEKKSNVPLDFENDQLEKKLKINIRIKNILFEEKLLSHLSVLGQASIISNKNDKNYGLNVTINEKVEKSAIELIAYKIFKNLDDLLGVDPKWHGGINGIMQLFVLLQIDQKLSRRQFN